MAKVIKISLCADEASHIDMLILPRAIEPFQKGEIPTFIAHIKAGLRVLEEQPDSMLVFSG